MYKYIHIHIHFRVVLGDDDTSAFRSAASGFRHKASSGVAKEGVHVHVLVRYSYHIMEHLLKVVHSYRWKRLGLLLIKAALWSTGKVATDDNFDFEAQAISQDLKRPLY